MGFLISLLLGFLPMLFYAWVVYWLDRYEKEPGRLVGGVFLWGALVAAGSAVLLNTLLSLGVMMLTRSEVAAEMAAGSLIAPVVEETLKALAVLLVFLLYRTEFDSLLDGIVYAGITALGFAATENAYYIYSYGYLKTGYTGLLSIAFLRVVLVGWQHPFYTAFTGLGLAVSRMSRRPLLKVAAPLIGWSAAVFTHSVHNTFGNLFGGAVGLMLGTLVDWSGWIAMGLIILWAIRREARCLARQLKEELELGLISPAQYRTACSAWHQSLARLNALPAGRYQATHRFYQVCAELAHKKEQRLGLGEEGGNSALIAGLRLELGQLAAQARSYPEPGLA